VVDVMAWMFDAVGWNGMEFIGEGREMM